MLIQNMSAARPRSQQPAVAWTPSRCNRALRKLTSLLGRVEKYWEENSNARGRSNGAQTHTLEDENATCKSGAHRTKDFVERGVLGHGAPKWATKSAVRKAPQTYASRKKQEQAPSAPPMFPVTPEIPRCRPGEISLATPFITGNFDDTFLSQPSHLDQINDPRHFSLTRSRPEKPAINAAKKRSYLDVKIKRRSKGEFEAADDPRYDALIARLNYIVEDFLAATADPASTTVSKAPEGAPSLFSMCQRGLAPYITNEQAIFDAQKYTDEPIEAAYSQVFHELEDLEECRPVLRGACRAFGIWLLCDAIERGVICWSTVTEECLEQDFMSDHTDALEAVTFALLTVQKPISWKDVEPEKDFNEVEREKFWGQVIYNYEVSPILHQIFQNLKRQAPRYPQRDILRFRIVTYMLRQGLVPVGLVAAEVTVLHDAIESLCSNDACSWAASELVETAALLACGLPRPLTSQSISSLRLACRPLSLDSGAWDPYARNVDNMVAGDSRFHEVNVTNNMFESILSITSGLVTARGRIRSQETFTGVRSSRQLLGTLCTALQQETELHVERKLAKVQCERLDKVWLASFFASEAKNRTPNPAFSTGLEAWLQHPGVRRYNMYDVIRSMKDFVYLVASQCGRARGERQSTAYLESFKGLIERLLAFNVTGFPRLQYLFYGTALEAAMRYACDQQ